MKRWLKNLILSNLFLKRIFIYLFEAKGRHPWGFGYGIYKMNYIQGVLQSPLDDFLKGQLPVNFGSRLDERVVEYPWVLSRIKKEDHVILDAGSSLNHDTILSSRHLLGKELYISTLANEGVTRITPQPKYVYEDLRKTAYANNFFDVIICLSTLEHVGLDNTFLYTGDKGKNENNRYAFLDAIDEFKRILKPGGRLFLTMPYGKHVNHGWFQVFDRDMVNRAVERFAPTKKHEAYFKYKEDQWEIERQENCQESQYFDIHKVPYKEGSPAASESIVCLELTK